MLHKKNTFAAVDPFVQKNRLHYGKRFHTNCYSASIFTIPCKSAGTAVRICILF